MRFGHPVDGGAARPIDGTATALNGARRSNPVEKAYCWSWLARLLSRPRFLVEPQSGMANSIETQSHARGARARSGRSTAVRRARLSRL